MAEKDSKTPLYDKHKHVHDLVSRIHDIEDAKETTTLYSNLHKVASDYFHKNKGIDGKISWGDKGDAEHKKFSDSLWDNTADHIAKHYLKMSDAAINDMKKGKTPDGESPWENLISHYLGGMDKEDFFEKVKGLDEFTIDNILGTYVKTLAEAHVSYRNNSLLSNAIKDPEHMDAVSAYLSDAKKHNKKALKPINVPKKFKRVEEARNKLYQAAHYLPKNYHPDKKDTYT